VRDDTTPDDTNGGAPSRGRATLLHLTLVGAAIAVLIKAGQVQLVQGAQWAAASDGQHVVVASLPAPRGTIRDDRGEAMAISREMLRLTIAPNQVRSATATRNERDSLAKALRALGVGPEVVRKAMDSTRTYVAVPGLYLRSDVLRLLAIRGVRADWTMERVAAGTTGMRRLVGALDGDGVAQSGFERALDGVLTGTRGERRAMRDRRGRAPWDSPRGARVEARPGHDVQLTVNQRLQEILERELHDAVARTGSSGGDLVVMDPNDGAILALAGVRNRRSAATVTPLTEAYQPGSVLKPMFVAWLLDHQRTRPQEVIGTGNGVWRVQRSTFTDTHKAAAMSVFDIVRWSSNVGTIRLVTERMTPDEQYEMLRDYGFGASTGLPSPESRGRLREPSRWTATSSASLAIGYELQATPVQLAAAYAALANGGELLEPALVREVRDPDGRVVFRHQRRVVRRVASEPATAEVRAMLKAVVDSGTGRAAGLATFELGGKSGTARRVIDGRYVDGKFDATFAGIFPMSDPQLVIVARLIEPEGQIFGGLVAGPMVRAVVSGALATRGAALDLAVLQRVARDVSLAATPTPKPAAPSPRGDATAGEPVTVALRRAPEPVPEPGRIVVSLPWEADAGAPVGTDRAVRAVPSVRGLSTREAVRTLHAAGFRVQLARGMSGRTRPSAGASLREGSLVVLEQGS
jgi:cell division protein FtsI (penicillin-binding protein 3)